ncbi:MAG: NAD(P)-dependent oxidoreductase [Candidatus Omnitrophica bacterium]|nr:NAD(P)-dependent oxidoreductase [Candidatus Omnitrophota bacterium]
MKKLTLIGTGTLGSAIARRLSQQGFDLMVYNRTKEKALKLSAMGIHVADNIRVALEHSDRILLVLSEKRAIDALIKKDDLVFENKLILQMGTITSKESVDLDEYIRSKGGEYLEAPVLGSRNETSKGALLIMVGGDSGLYQAQKDYLDVLGPSFYIGQVGMAATIKLALNHLIAAHAYAFSFSLGMVEKKGVPVEVFNTILKKSSLYAPMYDKKFEGWIKRDFSNPNFPTKHLLKDVSLIIKEAQEQNIDTQLMRALTNVIRKSLEMGLEDQDYSSIFRSINNL